MRLYLFLQPWGKQAKFSCKRAKFPSNWNGEQKRFVGWIFGIRWWIPSKHSQEKVQIEIKKVRLKFSTDFFDLEYFINRDLKRYTLQFMPKLFSVIFVLLRSYFLMMKLKANDFDIQIPIKILSQTKRDPNFFLTKLWEQAWFFILS